MPRGEREIERLDHQIVSSTPAGQASHPAGIFPKMRLFPDIKLLPGKMLR